MKDIKKLIHLIIDDPHYKITFNTLIDIRAIQYTPVVSEISVISDFIVSLKHYFKGKTAIVAEGELIYSMFKLSTLLITKQGLKSSIFHNPEEAGALFDNLVGNVRNNRSVIICIYRKYPGILIKQ